MSNLPQLHKPTWIETFSGLRVDPLKPDISLIKIEDIAHALSNCCRFAGHSRIFYSVARHSLLVYEIVKQHGANIETLKWALMHDAHQAYIRSFTPPMEYPELMAWYIDLETAWSQAISHALNIHVLEVDFSILKEAHNHARKLEAHQFMQSRGEGYDIQLTIEFEKLDWDFFAFEPDNKFIKSEFLETWEFLSRKKA